MSQPDSAVADAQGGAATESLAALAKRHGLRRAIARPSLPYYVGQLWARRHFVLKYATSRNVSKYSQSMLGQLWQLLTPLLNAGVYYLMFGVILDQKKDISNYTAFLITGVFIFTFTQRTVSGGAKSISNNLSLIRALHFPRAALPLAYAVQELQQLMWSMLVLIGIVILTGEPITTMWLFIPVALLLQLTFNIGASLFMARVGAFARDMNQLLPFIMRTWLYASGVFFSIPDRVADLPESLGFVQYIMELNPAAAYIELMRDLLIYDHPAPQWAWTTAIFWAVFALVIGFWYFWRAEERYGRG